VGEAAENSVLGRKDKGIHDLNIESIEEVHAWLETCVHTLREADAHLRGLAEETPAHD
jgi:hypothetical protein